MTLLVAGAKRGEWPTSYQGDGKREILEFALSATYLKELLDVGWCLSENTYNASIGKLIKIEPGIKLEIEGQKATAANTRDISTLQEKGLSKRTPRARDRKRDRSKDRDRDKGGGNSSKYYCNFNPFGRRHPSEGCLLVNGGGNRRDNDRGEILHQK